MDTNVRKERRRKIVERGGDRLALITGQARTLSASPSLPSPTPASSPSSATQRQRHAHTESSPSIMLISNDNTQTQIHAGPEETDGDSDSKLIKGRTINEYPGARIFHRGNPKEPCLMKSVTIPDPLSGMDKNFEISSSVQKPLSQAKLFSSKRINSCIIASERTRAICSLIIACVVVISNIDYPLIGFDIMSSDSLIASRPFCIILLTDVTIVLALLFLESGNDSEEVEEEKVAGKEDEDNWAGAVKLLERGLVLYQIIRGIFIDCSVYLVVVIFGLSLV